MQILTFATICIKPAAVAVGSYCSSANIVNSTLGIAIHFNDVIMSAMASQISGVSIVSSIVGSGADQRKHQSSASLAFAQGIHRWPLNSPHKRPVTRKMFPFDNVIMQGKGLMADMIVLRSMSIQPMTGYDKLRLWPRIWWRLRADNENLPMNLDYRRVIQLQHFN